MSEAQHQSGDTTNNGAEEPVRLWVWFAACWGGAAAMVGVAMLADAGGGGSGPNVAAPLFVLVFGGLIVAPVARSAVVLWRRKGVGARVVAGVLGLIVAALGVGWGSSAFHVLQRNRCGAQSIIESGEVRRASWALALRADAGGPMPRSVAEVLYDGAFDIEDFDRGCTECDLSEVRIGKYSARAIAGKRMTREELDAEIARVQPEPVAWERFGPIVMCLDARAHAEKSAMRIVGWGRSVDVVHEDSGWVNIAFSDGHTNGVYGRAEPWQVDALEESIAYYDSIGIPMPEEMVRELREAMGVVGK